MPDFSIAPDGYISEEPLHSASLQVSDTWPELDAQAVELNMLLVRCLRMIRASTEVVVDAEGFTLTRASAMGRLFLAGERGLTITELAVLLDVTHANASKLVDGLVKDGLVSKSTNPDDARSTNASLTPEGRARAAVVAPALYASIGDAWSGLTAQEKRVLSHLLSKVRVTTLAREGDVESWFAMRNSSSLPDAIS